MAKGESKKSSVYTPGKKPQGPLAPQGEFTGRLVDYGKAGPAGWNTKPGKYPNRRVRIELDVEDENTGKAHTVTDFVLAHPKMTYKVGQMAYAGGYTEEIEHGDIEKPTSPGIPEFCEIIDAMLTYLKENEVPLLVKITHEEYNGETQAKVVKYKPVDEGEPAAPDEEESEDEDDEEPVKPAKGKKGKAVEPEPEEDEEAEEDEDSEDTEEEEPEEEPAPRRGKAKAAAPVKGKGKR